MCIGIHSVDTAEHIGQLQPHLSYLTEKYWCINIYDFFFIWSSRDIDEHVPTEIRLHPSSEELVHQTSKKLLIDNFNFLKH